MTGPLTSSQLPSSSAGRRLRRVSRDGSSGTLQDSTLLNYITIRPTAARLAWPHRLGAQRRTKKNKNKNKSSFDPCLASLPCCWLCQAAGAGTDGVTAKECPFGKLHVRTQKPQQYQSMVTPRHQNKPTDMTKSINVQEAHPNISWMWGF